MKKMNDVEIITLCENSAVGRGFLAEHGLSMLIRRGNRRILFDTGQGQTLVHNATLMGINLREVDAVVLSHGHYDHTGGLQSLLEVVSPLKVYAHPDAFEPKYRLDEESPPLYIGIPWGKDVLEGWGAQLHLHTDPVFLDEGILITGSIPRQQGGKCTSANLCRKKEGNFFPDSLMDDQSLVLHTSKGLVVLVGCAHAGLVNILRYVRELTEYPRIHAVIGGMHLAGKSHQQVEEVVNTVKSWGVEVIGVSHCTGFKASLAFAREFGSNFFLNRVGVSTRL